MMKPCTICPKCNGELVFIRGEIATTKLFGCKGCNKIEIEVRYWDDMVLWERIHTDKRHYLHKQWYTISGYPELKCYHVNGRAHGMFMAWYTNGNLQVRTKYRYGEVHGCVKEWHSNGQLKCIGPHINGLVHGKHIQWHLNGKLQGVGLHKHGQPVGVHKDWDIYGRLQCEDPHHNGKSHGIVKYWSEGMPVQSHYHLYGHPATREEYQKHILMKRLAGIE